VASKQQLLIPDHAAAAVAPQPAMEGNQVIIQIDSVLVPLGPQEGPIAVGVPADVFKAAMMTMNRQGSSVELLFFHIMDQADWDKQIALEAEELIESAAPSLTGEQPVEVEGQTRLCTVCSATLVGDEDHVHDGVPV
jgi:hypothetical protein